MKITAYREEIKGTDVSVYAKSEAQLSIREIAVKNITGGQVYGEGHICYCSHSESDIDENEPFRRNSYTETTDSSTLIPLRGVKKAKSVTGIIGYTDESALVSFLNTKIDLTFKCDFTSKLLQANESGPGARKLKYISERLYKYISRDNSPFFNLAQNAQVEKDIRVMTICSGGSNYLIRRGRMRAYQRLFIWEKTEKHGGYKIARPQYIYHESDSGRYSKKESKICSYAGGELKFYREISEISAGLLADAESNARYYAASYADLIPDNGLCITAVLRVPTRAEFKSYREKNGKPAAGGAVIKRLHIVEPSLKAAVVKPGTPVIDDIAVFERIMSGVSNGIYQPGNAVYSITADKLDDKEQFLFLMKAA